MADGRVLVVDDEENILDLCCYILGDEGYRVDRAQTAEEALRKVNVDEYDIFILDVNMPKISGLELLEVLNQRFPNTVKIVITAHANLDVVTDALRKGCDDFLTKPFNNYDLLSSITRSVEKLKLRTEIAELKNIIEIYDLCRTMDMMVDTKTLLDLIFDIAMRMTDGQSGSLMLFDEKKQKLYVEVHRGLDEEIIPVDGVALDEGISGAVAKELRPIIVPKTDIESFEYKKYLKKKQKFSSISVPLKRGNRLVGILNLNRPEEKPEFSEKDTEFLVILATHAAMSIENSRLYDSLCEANIELTMEKETLNSIIDNLYFGVAVIDERQKVTMYNASIKKILGIEEEIQHKRIGDVIDVRLKVKIDETIQEMDMSGVNTLVKEFDIMLFESARNLRMVMSRIKIESDVEHVYRILIIEDLTRYNNLQKLAAWRDAARKLAHEVANPLTPIQLCVERIRRRYENDPIGAKKVIEDCTETVVKEVTGMKNLLSEFSSFAKLPEPVFRKLNVNTVLSDVIEMYRDNDVKAEIEKTLTGDVDEVMGDGNLLSQCFINIVKNAIEAMPDGGKLKIASSKVGDVVRIEFIDTGKGIEEEILGKIFSPYFTTKKTGTGIGLAIVQKIISDHRGEVKVSSAVGKGTRFTVILPI